jgi:hypothetical protein
MRSVPIAMVVEAAGSLENAGQLDAAGAHEVDIRLGGFVTILEGALFLRLSPKHLVVPIGIERGINIDEIHALTGELAELVQAVPAIDNSRIE